MWENCLHVWLNNTFVGFQQMIDFPFGESHRLGMTQIPVRATGSRNSTVLEEVGGCSGVSFSGRERSHGGEDQGQAVCDVLVWRAGQSWRESWRQSSGKDQYMTRSFWYSWETHTPFSSRAMTAAPRVSNTCTTVARPFLAAMWRGLQDKNGSHYRCKCKELQKTEDTRNLVPEGLELTTFFLSTKAELCI